MLQVVDPKDKGLSRVHYIYFWLFFILLLTGRCGGPMSIKNSRTSFYSREIIAESKQIFLTLSLIFLLVISFAEPILAERGREMVDALDKAIERTKLHHSADRESYDAKSFRANPLKSSLPLRSEELDVERLNLLIKTIDKSWIMPKMGFQEAVGSNFQYKKTCASIFKARENACGHPGFGIMCFNFCFEQGEKLLFKCEDSSDFNFCKSNSNFDQYLTKYKKDPYRAKAYIHQMLTRCYLSAVCNGNTLLNATLMGNGKATKYRSVPLGNGIRSQQKGNKLRADSTNDAKNDAKNGIKKTSKAMANKGRRMRLLHSSTATEKEIYRPNSDDDEHSKKYVTPKYVPYWRKLLVRTTTESLTTTTQSSILASEEEDYDEFIMADSREFRQKKPSSRSIEEDTEIVEDEQGAQHSKTHYQSTATRVASTAASFTEARRTETVLKQNKSKKQNVKTSKYIWKSLPSKKRLREREYISSVQARSSMRKAMAAPPESLAPVGFWKVFEPNRWFESIHYLTNTG